jgi:hypothetical protein
MRGREFLKTRHGLKNERLRFLEAAKVLSNAPRLLIAINVLG